MSSQESIILGELIYSLVGVKGHFIVPDTSCSNIDPVRFKVSDQIHESLKDMIQQIVPLISHYSQVQRFILKASDPNCGLVLQALGAALRVLTYDYYVSCFFLIIFILIKCILEWIIIWETSHILLKTKSPHLLLTVQCRPKKILFLMPKYLMDSSITF